MSFLLGATVLLPLGSDPIKQFGVFAVALRNIAVPVICDSRQARSNGLPGGAVAVPSKPKLSNS
jgi:hypothetical protein